LFTPLLPSTTTGVLDFRSIIEPIRSTKHDLHYYQAECEGINPVTKTIKCAESYNCNIKFELSYDELVIAVGAENNTFHIPGVHEHCFFLKELHHSRAIRSAIIRCFEEASIPGISHEQRRQLNFVVVGGGPTGVEFAGENYSP